MKENYALSSKIFPSLSTLLSQVLFLQGEFHILVFLTSASWETSWYAAVSYQNIAMIKNTFKTRNVFQAQVYRKHSLNCVCFQRSGNAFTYRYHTCPSSKWELDFCRSPCMSELAIELSEKKERTFINLFAFLEGSKKFALVPDNVNVPFSLQHLVNFILNLK